MAGAARGSQARIAARVVVGAALIGFPVLAWIGLTQWGPRALSLVLLALFIPTAAVKLRGGDRGPLTGLAAIPLVTVAALTLAALLDAEDCVLAVPVAINGVLLAGFGATLRRGSMPMIERLARLQEADLSSEQRAWCRLWTTIWCAFFLVNGGTALLLALAAPLSWWAIYNGMVAYALMGILFGGEWVLRRRRFARS